MTRRNQGIDVAADATIRGSGRGGCRGTASVTADRLGLGARALLRIWKQVDRVAERGDLRGSSVATRSVPVSKR
jgi:hypothetical protein